VLKKIIYPPGTRKNYHQISVTNYNLSTPDRLFFRAEKLPLKLSQVSSDSKRGQKNCIRRCPAGSRTIFVCFINPDSKSGFVALIMKPLLIIIDI